MATTRLSPLALAAAVLIAGCGDGTGPGTKPIIHPEFPVPGDALATLTCTAQVQSLAVSCSGGGKTLEMTGSNVSKASGVVGVDVAFKNLVAFKLGTDGASTTGLEVFFASGPNVSGGSGAVTVRNPDARVASAPGEQPVYRYAQSLSANQSSTPRRWEFTASSGVTAFTFKVYVQATVLPVVVFDRLVDGNRDLYRVALDGSDLVRLTTHGGEDLDPTVGGGTVVFTSYRSGNGELWSMPLLGGTETRLTTTAATETDAALSRDGTRLAYSSDAVVAAKVWTANPDGSGAARATPGSFGIDASPEASPAWFPGAARRLAFVGTSTGSADIYDYTMPGTPTQLRGGTSVDITPAFSPDSQFLSYSTNAGEAGNTDLWVLKLADGTATRLTTRPGTDGSGSWTHDGRIVYLAFTGRGTPNELRWVNPSTGATGTIPMPAGGEILRPYAAPF